MSKKKGTSYIDNITNESIKEAFVSALSEYGTGSKLNIIILIQTIVTTLTLFIIFLLFFMAE